MPKYLDKLSQLIINAENVQDHLLEIRVLINIWVIYVSSAKAKPTADENMMHVSIILIYV